MKIFRFCREYAANTDVALVSVKFGEITEKEIVMLMGKHNAIDRNTPKMKFVICLGLLIMALIFALSACKPTKGSIVILENLKGTGFTMDFKEWSEKNKCELSLSRDDVLQIEVTRESGEIALITSGKKGSEPYTGNDLQSGIFTVTVPETDEYAITIVGDNATGNVSVKNLGGKK